MSGDVLEEAPKRFNCLDDSSNNRAKVSWIVRPLPLAGTTERLARVARKNKIKASSKSLCREGSQIRPHNFDSQLTLFSLGNQVRQCVGFDLHSNDSKRIRQCAGQSEFETAVSGA
jgi:hypothetical protein